MRRRGWMLVAVAATVVPGMAAAQADLAPRIGKLESEMRAVQRKVFPGGAGRTVEPDVTAPVAAAQPLPGTPASSALADLTSRVAALEGQVATLTGQVEQNGYKLRQLSDAFEAYKRATDARLVGQTSGVATPPPADEPAPIAPVTPRGTGPRPAPRPSTAAADLPPPAPAAADAGAIARPSSGDDAEDAYIYGYRLWQAKRYGEAEAQFKKVVADYPKSRRASYAQNLLGRSYLDEGKPSLASMAFYDNYKKMPDGERAPESLYYLAQALVRLNKPADACKVYGELTDVYGSKIAAGMKADVARGRAAAKCG